MKLSVEWKGGMAFEATPPTGNKFTMDAYPEVGGQGLGPTPLEALVGSVAACTAMDVISILAKKKQVVTSYHLEVEEERGPEGQYPRPILRMNVTHVLKGENLDEAAVARAVSLSDEKYCTVAATLRSNPEITTDFRIE